MQEDTQGIEGARDLLQGLPQHTLLSLCEVITRCPAQCCSDEAVDKILQHPSDLESILKRKMITRDILFKYLMRKGTSVTVNTNKKELIEMTLSLWTNGVRENVQEISKSADGQNMKKTLLQTMGEKFVQWFYPLLRECNLHDVNFWDNSEIVINLLSVDGNSQTNAFSGVSQVLNAIKQLVQVHGVILSPNPHGAVAVETDPHGLVLISCSGIVHQYASCVGVYDQKFALTSDPYAEGDWRIKRSQLDMKVEMSKFQIQNRPAIEN